ncbi:MAG: PadR family transcriptional regulator [Desulfomonilaceae bacterium]
MTSYESENSHQKNSRNPAEYIVLGVVAINSTHGYEIVKFIQTELNSIWKLRRSQIYAILGNLERDKLLKVLRVDQEKAPAKKIFSVTRMGHEEFKRWMEFQDPKIKHMRIELLGKVFFALRLGGDNLRELLTAQLNVCRAKADRLKSGIKNESNEIGRLALSFRISQVEASIQWLTEICERNFPELCGAKERVDFIDKFSLVRKEYES